MELIVPSAQPQTISRSEVYPVYKDYRALLDKGYELIAKYSGSLWTNYNDSDPGVTILQNICYALTELGNKADLPIRDILSTKSGIRFHQQFYKPQQVLSANPVTLIDFAKLLLNEIPELKQVYFLSPSITSAIQCQLEIKPECLAQVSTDISFIEKIEGKAKNVLVRHGNISQIFTRPRVLSPSLVRLEGAVSISKTFQIEKAMAFLLFNLNNCLSAYPVYKSYSELVKQGFELTDLLTGPYLNGGWISDSNIASKRQRINSQELNVVCLETEGVEDSHLLISFNDVTADPSGFLNVSHDEAPYFSIESFARVQILQNSKEVKGIDSNKINYYLYQLISVQQPSDLDDLLPTGEYRELQSYYSVQNNFPSVYQLTGKGPADATHQAKVRQLKAYLFLFEQIMGDYLAQLGNVSSLFSLESGRSDYQLTSPTYFTQPLYDVPGIDRVLSGVHDDRSGSNRAAKAKDWQDYQQNPVNPYATILATKASNAEDDLSRKLRAMEHLLARFGKTYDHQPLRLANPNYGKDVIAEMEYISQTLQNFPLLSANQTRTYFKVDGFGALLSGLEINFQNELGLHPFLQGTIEIVRDSLDKQKTIEIVYYTSTGRREVLFPKTEKNPVNALSVEKFKWVEVWCNNDLLLSFHAQEELQEMTEKEAEDFLQLYTRDLEDLAAKYQGFILIDFARLAGFLSFRWVLKSADGTTPLYRSGNISLDRLERQLISVEEGSLLEIKEISKGTDYEIGARTHQHRYLVCDGIHSLEEAEKILDRLNSVKGNLANVISIEILDREESSFFLPLNKLVRNTFCLFPQWISAFQNKVYQDLLQSKLVALSPPATVCETCFLPMTKFHQIMLHYEVWMRGLIRLYEGGKPDQESVRAALELIKLLAVELNDKAHG